MILTSPVSPSISIKSPVFIKENKSMSSGKSAIVGIDKTAEATPDLESILENSQPEGLKPETAAE